MILCILLIRDNLVDYIKETDLYYVFQLFDMDRDGNLDYEDFL